jgi:hypothetical protein
VEDQPILAVEVRAKSVPPSEVDGFVSACYAAAIERAFVVVLWTPHKALPVSMLRQKSLDEKGILLTIIEQAEDLLLHVFGWSDLSLPAALSTFVMSVLTRLKEIEATEQSLERWVAITEELRSKT